MQLFDKLCFKLLKKLNALDWQSFTDLNVIVSNKSTLSHRLKFLLNENLIHKKKMLYLLSDRGLKVLKLLDQLDSVLQDEDYLENYDSVPYLFRDYLYNFITTLKNAFEEKLLSAILFGSVARGKWTSNSDLDIFLIFSDDAPEKTHLSQRLAEVKLAFYKTHELKNQEGKTLYHPFQLLHHSVNELETFRTLFYDIVSDGILMIDRNGTGANFIKRIKQRIKRVGLKRIFNGNDNYYWQHEPIKFGETIEL